MTRIPDDFRDEFEQKGDTFLAIAELLYRHPDRQYTQDELATEMECSNTTVSGHIGDMEEEGWVDKHEDQVTYTWNSEAHNPASTEGLKAVKFFYQDFWSLLKKHSATVPGTFAILGFSLITVAFVMFSFFAGFSIGIAQASSVPSTVYLGIGIGSFLTGVIATIISPIQAMAHRASLRIVRQLKTNKER